ncbi:MAG: hypothetical protein EA403_15265 [Spirochaetaceae bacterium]|nr:MAG: hypothetical protein EA403_15265 [Spirochaetaceae bacterium]
MPEENRRLAVLADLRDRFKWLAVFDDGDSGDIYYPEALPLVDEYWKKQLYRDRNQYPAQIASQMHKIRLAWNLGIGSFPVSSAQLTWARRAVHFLSPHTLRFFYRDPRKFQRPGAPKENFVSARFPVHTGNSIVRDHRALFQKTADQSPLFRTGTVPRRQFYAELDRSTAVLSPYGYGEICFRDFEAILHESVLFKPDMSHLETWPDVYLPMKTYVPLEHDGSDLIARAREVIQNPMLREELVNNASRVYRAAFEELQTRLDLLLSGLEIS